MEDQLKILADAEQPEGRRIEAARAIGKARDHAAIDRMFIVADRSETLLVRAIMEALKEMGAHETLARRLQDPDPVVRADAARKLSKMQDERAADALIAASRDREAIVRRAAMHALSYLRSPKVYEVLALAIRDPDPETRAYAAAGVGRSGDPRAQGVLRVAREAEEDDVVKDFIDAALRKLPGRGAPNKAGA